MANPATQKVKIVIDSTADMSQDALRRLNVNMVPLMVLIGNETYRDGLDITPHEFYSKLAREAKLPTTSQPSQGAFMEVYQKATADGSKVISIHLSAKLSGTYENALVASRNFQPGQVRVFDTQQVSAGVAFFVQTAAEMARNNFEIEAIEKQLESMRDRVKLLAMVDTLEYLHKGGRIGGLSSFFGSLLNVKPLLQLKEGEVQPLERVRTRQKALQRLAELVKGMGKLERLAIMHADDENGAGELANLLAPVFPLKEIYMSTVGPVIGAHVGPGCLAVVIQKAK